MKLFSPERATLCDDVEQVPTPIGEACLYCEESIEADDRGFLIPHWGETVTEEPWHQECLLRSVIGSVGHQLHHCECYGIEDISEGGLTKREAARHARDFMKRQVAR
jgi:hypothetical protein